MHTMNPYETVGYSDIIWDWNGTLFDDAWLCIETINTLLRQRGCPTLTPEDYAERFRFPVEAYYRDLPFDWTRERFEDVGLEFIRIYEARRLECPLRAGAIEALHFFRERGVRQHLISGYHQRALEEIVAYHGLAGWFDEIVGADDPYARGKMDLGLRWASRRAPGRRLVIGDTVHDFELAQGIGADCILIPTGHNSRSRLEATGALVLDDLHAIPRWWARTYGTPHGAVPPSSS